MLFCGSGAFAIESIPVECEPACVFVFDMAERVFVLHIITRKPVVGITAIGHDERQLQSHHGHGLLGGAAFPCFSFFFDTEVPG